MFFFSSEFAHASLWQPQHLAQKSSSAELLIVENTCCWIRLYALKMYKSIAELHEWKAYHFISFELLNFSLLPTFCTEKEQKKNVSSYVGRKDWLVCNEDLSRPESHLHLWLTQETRNKANLALPLSVLPACIYFSRDNSFCVFWIWLPLMTLPSLLMTLQSCMEKSGAFGRQHAAFWHYHRWQFSFYFQTGCECSPFPSHPWFCRHLPHPHITPSPGWRAWGYPFIPCMEAGLHTLVIFNHKTHPI